MEPERIKQQIDQVLVKLPQPVQEKLDELAKTTGQPKSVLAGAVAVLSLLIFLFLCPPPLVFSFVGVAYPLYASLKMLADEQMDEAPMWITYWCLFTLFKMVMGPVDFILSFLPFYFYLKLALLVWLFAPTTKGAKLVYEKGLQPFVLPMLVSAKSD